MLIEITVKTDEQSSLEGHLLPKKDACFLNKYEYVCMYILNYSISLIKKLKIYIALSNKNF